MIICLKRIIAVDLYELAVIEVFGAGVRSHDGRDIRVQFHRTLGSSGLLYIACKLTFWRDEPCAFLRIFSEVYLIVMLPELLIAGVFYYRFFRRLG
jgi:hypothetical protein